MKPEPEQIRANVLSGIFKNGDEGAQLTFDDATRLVYVKKPGFLRVVPAEHCAWIELQLEEPPEPPKK